MKIFQDLYLIGSGRYGISHPFDCNVYLLKFPDELIMIDAGAGVHIQPLINNIKKDGLTPGDIGKIFITHSHADHAGGGGELRKKLGCEVYAPRGADKLIEEGTDEDLGLSMAIDSGLYSKDYQYPHYEVNLSIDNNETFTFKEGKLTAIKVPGHSKYSTCFLVRKEGKNMLFTGDTVFFDGKISLLNCPGSSLGDYRENINKLSSLSVDLLLPGHGIFTLKEGQKHVNKAIHHLSKIGVPPLHSPTSGKARDDI